MNRGLLPLLCTLALACAACAGSGGLAEPWWPPQQPRHPERLQLLNPAASGEQWWADNVLSQLPQKTYATAEQGSAAQLLAEEVNRVRSAYGLQPLAPLPELNRAAQAHAVDQAVRDYWSHCTPEGLSSHQRIHAAGAGTVSAGGENSSIGCAGQLTPAQVVYAWEHHCGHVELLLDPDVRYIGTGCASYSAAEFTYFVALLVDLDR